MLGCLVTGIVVEAGFVGGLGLDRGDRGGIVGDATVVEGEMKGAFECLATMLGGVPCRLCEDPREGADTPELVIGGSPSTWGAASP